MIKPTVAELLSLNGRRALVTGGSGNIGRSIAVRLAEAGADMVVHYHADADGAAETARAIENAGRSAITVQADLTEPASVAGLFAAIDESGPRVDCVVNNAGSFPVQDFHAMSGDDWRAVIASNLDSAASVAREAIRRMREGSGGSIVNIASVEGSDPAPAHAHYAAAKAALLMLSRSLTLEYGRSGIRCNSVSPGLIHRDGIEDNWPDGVGRWLDKVPLSRLGDAMDVADAVLFLLSPAARWISGVNLVVDGGMSSAARW